MSLGKSNELWELGEDPEEAQGLLNALQSTAEEEEEGQVPSPWSLPSLSSSSPSLSLYGLLGPTEEGSATEGSPSPPQSSQSANSSPSGRAARGLGQPQPAGPNSPGQVGSSGSEGQEDAVSSPYDGQPKPAGSYTPGEVVTSGSEGQEDADPYPCDGAASGLGQLQPADPYSSGEVVARGSERQEDADLHPCGGASGGLGQPQPASPYSPEEVGSSPPEQQEDEQPEGSFHMKTAALVMFLLLKYRIKQPISKEQMLEVITPEFQDDFPVILSQASRCLKLVLGLDVIEVDPIEHCYHLNIILGLTWDGMVSGQGGLPKTSLLGLVLGLIVLEDDCAPEEEVWEALRVMEVYDGQEHIIYGEPRDLLTNVWVQEGYLECRPVVGSDPARYEFLWGPRAHVETSKLQVMDYAFQVSSSLVVSSLALCEQILR
ncbi:Melanoma-associated antigen 10 [Vulpes lagopus]